MTSRPCDAARCGTPAITVTERGDALCGRHGAAHRRVYDPRTPDQAFFDLCRHLESVHLYDFSSGCPDPGHDGYALDNLHEELHRRGDFGAYRHRLASHERYEGPA